MRLLVIYGQNALGRKLMSRLTKEGCYVVCMDKTIAGLDKSYAAKEYSLEFAESLQEAFRINNFDGVIYLGDTVIDHAGSYTDGGVLEKAFLHCREYKVKRFMYVCQNNYESSPELAVRKAIDDQICEQYAKIFVGGLKKVTFDNIYGEGLRCGLLWRLLRAAESKSGCPVKQGAELVYLDDAVDLLWRVWKYVGSKRRFKQFALNCSEHVEDMEALYASICYLLHGEGGKSAALARDSAYAEGDFIAATEWKPRYKLEEELEKIMAAYKNRYQQPPRKAPRNWRKILQPYVENIALFIILIFINQYFQDGRYAHSLNRPDFSYVYILIMGLLYGKIQAAWAVFLASAFIIFRYLDHGADMVSIFYSMEPMVHIGSYLFLGTAVGYVTDAKNRQLDEYVWQLGDFKRRFDFLYSNYLETAELKDTFYKQVLNNSKSLGRVVHIVRQLESVHLEQLFSSACEAVGEFLGVENVAIYSVSRNGYYLRLRVHKGDVCESLPQSLKIESHPYLEHVINEKHSFVNKELQQDVPDMAAPILFGDKAIAVIQLHAIPFEKFALQNEVMLRVVSLLVATAIKKAVMYEELLYEKMCLPDTRIMRNEYYSERLAEVRRQEDASAPAFRRAALLSVNGIAISAFAEGNGYGELWDSLNHLIREEDVVGIADDGGIEIIFFGLTEAFVASVTARLQGEGVALRWLEEAAI